MFKPIRALLGGRIRFVLSGGAPLAPETHKALKNALCCPVLQGYGLTETCAGTTVMDADDDSLGIDFNLFCLNTRYNTKLDNTFRLKV